MEQGKTRRLDVEGAWNVRDIGGYCTTNGRHVRWRTLFRADSLHKLTDNDQKALLGLGLRSVIDLRQSNELAEFPNVFADSAYVRYHHHNVIGDEQIPYPPVIGTPADEIVDSYLTWLKHRQLHIGRVLVTLARPDALPAMYHCAGGKDRTGVISSLLLGIAGVPEETIADDYGLTARFLWERWQVESPPVPGPVKELDGDIKSWQDYQRLFCPPDAMHRVLDFLNREYGGSEGYARSAGLSDQDVYNLYNALVD